MGGSVLFTLILRGVLSPFAHPLFTSMTGIGAGIAANSRNAAARPFYVLGGYALAVILHALWNSSASFFDGGAFLLVYAVVMVPLFAAMVTIVIWQRHREQAVIAEQLPGFAQAGWIAPSEIQLLSSLAGRRGWRTAVRQRSGRAVEQAVVRYQAAVTDLAFLRDRIAKGRDRADGPAVARRGRRRGHPGATAGRRAPGGAHGGAAPPRRRGGLEPTAAGAARARGSRSRPTCPRRAGRTDDDATRAAGHRGGVGRTRRRGGRRGVGRGRAPRGGHLRGVARVGAPGRRAAARRAAAAARRGRGPGRPRAARRARRRAPRPRPRPRGGRELPRGPDRRAHLGRARGVGARARGRARRAAARAAPRDDVHGPRRGRRPGCTARAWV